MKKRKFADGGALEELASGKSKGSFDEDVYKRAQAFMQKGDKEEAAAEEKRTVRSVRPKASTKVTDTGDETERMVRRAPAPSAKSEGRAEIPVDSSMRGPAKSGRIPSDLESNIRNTAAALTPIGVGGAMRATKGLTEAGVKGWEAGRKEAAAAEEALSQIARRPVAAQRATSGSKYTPKQEMEAAESTMRGATNRKAIQEARAKRLGRDELEKTFKSSMGYAKGGRVDGCAIRGKTRGRMV